MKYDEIQERLTQIVVRKQEIIKNLEILSRQEKMVETDIQRVRANLNATRTVRDDFVESEVVFIATYKKIRRDLAFITVALKQKQEALAQIQLNQKQLVIELKLIRDYESRVRKELDENFGRVVYLNDRKRTGIDGP